MIAAVLDTCVLWPSLQRDVLLSLAAHQFYRPLWGSGILQELEFHEAAKLVERGQEPETATARSAHLIAQMTTAFDDATISGWERFENAFALPDPDDAHVLATAVVGRADVVVTENTRDFPASQVPDGIRILRARDFVTELIDGQGPMATDVLHEMATRYTNPTRSARQILDTLRDRYGWAEFHAEVGPHLAASS